MSRTHQVSPFVLGLVLWMAGSAPLVAQDGMDSVPMSRSYRGISFTDAQKKQIVEINRKHPFPAQPDLEATKKVGLARGEAYRTVLTPEQRKIVERNIQIRDFFNTAAYGARERIFLGLDLTEAQMTALQKFLAAEKEKEKAIYQPLPKDSAGRLMLSMEQGQQLREQRKLLFDKSLDDLYALLTPEQQKVAAPRLKELPRF